jgi:hypothetical protein
MARIYQWGVALRDVNEPITSENCKYEIRGVVFNHSRLMDGVALISSSHIKECNVDFGNKLVLVKTRNTLYECSFDSYTSVYDDCDIVDGDSVADFVRVLKDKDSDLRKAIDLEVGKAKEVRDALIKTSLNMGDEVVLCLNGKRHFYFDFCAYKGKLYEDVNSYVNTHKDGLVLMDYDARLDLRYIFGDTLHFYNYTSASKKTFKINVMNSGEDVLRLRSKRGWKYELKPKEMLELK